MFKKLILSSFFLFGASCAKADEPVAPTPDFNGVWQNDMGSHVTFNVSDGVVHGKYNTNVGEPDKSQGFPLVGLVEGDQITFTVNFKGFGSMTAWTGQLTEDDKGELYIRTLWHLTKDIEDELENEEIWGSVRTGASNFTRVD